MLIRVAISKATSGLQLTVQLATLSDANIDMIINSLIKFMEELSNTNTARVDQRNFGVMLSNWRAGQVTMPWWWTKCQAATSY